MSSVSSVFYKTVISNNIYYRGRAYLVFFLLFGWAVTGGVTFCYADPADISAYEGDWIADGPIGGNISAVIIHPTNSGLLYAGTDDGRLYHSEDRGNTWYEFKPGLGIEGIGVSCLAFYPATPDILYAGTVKVWNPGGLFRSLDRGESWNRVSAGIGNLSVHKLQYDPTNPAVLYAATENGVYKSIDGGSN